MAELADAAQFDYRREKCHSGCIYNGMEPRQYKKYTDEDIIFYAKHTKSLAGLLKALNLKCAGGNYGTLKRRLQSLKVDCSHWTGRAWNKGEQLKDWEKYRKIGSLRKILIEERGNSCENCGIDKWINFPIILEMDHIDGDRTNNDKSNLKLLCPNCHSQTSTWRGRKLKLPQ